MERIRPGDVRPGKCFTAAADGKVRRVVAVRDGVVAFDVRKGQGSRTDWGGRSELPVPDFIAASAREVGCDF